MPFEEAYYRPVVHHAPKTPPKSNPPHWEQDRQRDIESISRTILDISVAETLQAKHELITVALHKIVDVLERGTDYKMRG